MATNSLRRTRWRFATLSCSVGLIACRASAPPAAHTEGRLGATPTETTTATARTSAGGAGEALSHIALRGAPGFVLVVDEHRGAPATWEWTVPRDGCFRLFARGDASLMLSFGEHTATLETNAATATRVPVDGPLCARAATKIPLALRGAGGRVELAIVGSAPAPGAGN